jgi:hypothetical protein
MSAKSYRRWKLSRRARPGLRQHSKTLREQPGPNHDSRFTVLHAPLLFDYEHEQEANRNSPVATQLILPNVPRFHRI